MATTDEDRWSKFISDSREFLRCYFFEHLFYNFIKLDKCVERVRKKWCPVIFDIQTRSWLRYMKFHRNDTQILARGRKIFVAQSEHSFCLFQVENIPWSTCVLLTSP